MAAAAADPLVDRVKFHGRSRLYYRSQVCRYH
jgi:hypothetical protein